MKQHRKTGGAVSASGGGPGAGPGDLFAFRELRSGGAWAASAFNRHIYNSKGQLAVGRVLDRDGDLLSWVDAEGNRAYYANPTVRKATLHAVGDAQGKIGTGALVAFGDKLSGYNLLTGAYSPFGEGNDLYLTLDAHLNYVAYHALNGRKGAVGVYNYKTGEILCMVSNPSYDPADPPEIQEGDERYEGVYLNRFLSGTFVPGSVFKTVTLAAAVEHMPDLMSRTFTCTGSTLVGGEAVTCPGAHGELDIYGALASSCNGVFAQLAAELGPEVMEAYTRKAGLTGSYRINGLSTAKGRFQFSGATANQLGWAGVGQYNDLVNPCALMVYMGAIASGGKAAVPQLILQNGDAAGFPGVPVCPAPDRAAGGGGHGGAAGRHDGTERRRDLWQRPVPQHGPLRQVRHWRGGGREGAQRLVCRVPTQ